MKHFRITTPTVLDIREIVTLGLTSKADGSKIGSKGTGLKFILAYLHRLGGFLDARGPDYHIRSETVPVTIRDKDHRLIQIRSRNADGRIWETHMTLHAGADTWNEPWFVLRELVQNALDEGGQYELTEEETLPATKGTTVQVPLLPELVKAWDERDVWMQPRYPGVIGNGHPAIKGLYFHGFLVYRATAPWDFSYDVTDVLKRSEISEDRQVRNVDLSGIFHRIVERMDFEFEAPMLYKKALEVNPREDVVRIYDAVYNIMDHSHTSWGGPGGFKLSRLEEAFHERHGRMAAFTSAAVTEADPNIYYARAAGFLPVTVSYRLSNILSAYTAIKAVGACLPTIAQRLKKIKRVDVPQYEKLKLALRLLRKIKPAGIKVEIVTKIMASDTIKCQALADAANNRILVLDSLLDQDIPEIAKVLIEEFAHMTSGGGDMSMELQRALIDTIYDLLTRNRKVNVSDLRT